MDVQTPFQSLGKPPAQTLCQLYQCHVEQLVEQLPLWAAWIVYHTETCPRKRVYASPSHFPGASHTLKSYLESEVWMQAGWPVQTGSLLLAENSIAYVYPLGSEITFSLTDKPPEYLLLWSREPLSLTQQQAVEHQVHLLGYLLTLDRRCHQQQTEVDLLEQILQRVGHQLGNPLALIRLSAEMLPLGLPPTLYQEQVTQICETADRIKTYLNDLIQCGRRSSLHLAPHNLQEILAESLQELRPWFDEKKLQHNIATAFVTVEVDRFQLKQVFDNLLSNAIAFSPPGSTITCHWQVFAHEVLVQVRDQGPGLSEAELAQIFTPFYSRRPGGKGLGLAIAQKIILDHQGRLWAETLPTGGAQFSFTLPRNRSEA